MDRELLRIFHLQILAQCRFAVLAHDDFRQRGRALQAAHEDSTIAGLTGREAEAEIIAATLEPSLDLWQYVQAMLTAVANISKALWGQSGSRAAERTALRAALEVEDDSPLRPTSMRNHYDHFDERLVEWWARSRGQRYVDLNIGPESDISDVPLHQRFRHYDPDAGQLTFWGDEYHLPTIRAEIERIAPLAAKGAAA